MNTSSISIRVEMVSEISLITVDADHIDSANAEVFRKKIAPYLNESHRVIIDLSSLKFIDSSGLGSILFCMREITAKNGTLKICGLNQSVRLFFELARMHRLIDMEETREDAIKSFPAQQG